MAAMLMLLLPAVGELWSQSGFFRLDDLRPGMKGIGRTCYRGSQPEEFQVEILGIMHRMNPGGDAILAKLTGGPLAETGVFEGMSGSPVFIDGKLLGAVAFSFAFAKDAIAGITPISQMVDAFAEGIDGIGIRATLKKSMLWNYRFPKPDGIGPAAEMQIANADGDLRARLSGFAGHALQPIATPLSVGGFSAETLRIFGPQFRELGFSMLQGTGASVLQSGASSSGLSVKDDAALEPGSNLVIALVSGDLDVSAGGTITHIDGKKLYAFGHPLFNLGFSDLPMYKGKAITVFPSLQSSFKILETTEPIGTLRQDRSMGVYGILGERPRMIPMRIRTRTSRGVQKAWNFEVANDRLLTPLLLNLTIYETINATERSLGYSTLRVKGKIGVKGELPIEVENCFSSPGGSSVDAALSIAAPVNFLLASGYKDLQFDNIDIEVSAVEDDMSAALESIRVDRTELKAGESLNLDIFFQKANGEISRESYPVEIPEGMTPGPLSIMVADGNTVMQMDATEQGDDLIPRDLSQVIKFINDLRKNDRMYLRMFRQQAGAVIHGEGLPGLPPSVLSILRSERRSGNMSVLHTLPLVEIEFPGNDYVVSGSRSLNLVIQP
jgi:hypothetical protein